MASVARRAREEDMGKHTYDRARLVAATANRLRLIQIDFADEPPEVRRGYLEEALEGALAEVLPEEREVFLEELKERFPTWDPNVELQAPEAPPPTTSPLDAQELRDPSFLVTRLVEEAKRLSDEERRGITRTLQESGLAPRPTGGLPREALAKVREALGVKGDAALAEDRLVGLLAMLVDFACSLDPLVWRTWGKVAPKSKVQSLGSLRHALHRFATGDERVGDGEVKEEVLKLRHMLASMVVALGQAGRIAAADVVSGVLGPLSPSKIEDLVRFERGGFFVAKEVKCWNKYKELAGKHNEVNVEAAIREKIQHFVEELMRRRNTRRE